MRFRLPRLDPYIVGILCAVGLASVFPVRGDLVAPYGLLTKIAVAVLFFLYGARLPRETVIAGLVRWRLHLLALSITFVVFPLIGFAALQILPVVLAPALLSGFVYLCCVPSTVQSSVIFVATARGNVAAAVCSASASNLFGVVISPLLVGLLVLHAQGGGVSMSAVQGIFLQLLAPFVIGQIVYPWVGGWLERRKKWLAPYDRTTILMIVYGAFSAAMVGGIWREVSLVQLVVLALLSIALLAVILFLSARAARAAKLPVEDEIVVVFCGTQKSIAAGVSMAALLFPASAVGLIVLPLMIYHQFQLMASAVLAARYARRGDAV